VIVDCHVHVWESLDQLGLAGRDGGRRGHLGPASPTTAEAPLEASPQCHLAASEPVTKSFVLGFKSRYLGAEIPNSFVAAYVQSRPERLIGVCGIDPTDLSQALDDLAQARTRLGMKAVAMSPAAQEFHPADSRAMQIFAEAAKLGMPVFIHQGLPVSPADKLDFARPVLLDEVARELPQLKIVIAHLGYPWIEECVCLLGKHANVFADVSALSMRPWHAYQALLSAHQYGVMDKLLFGSDFPYTTPTAAIESLYRLNQLVIGTNLPPVPRSLIAGIIERDALVVLGIDAPIGSGAGAPRPDAHDA
jgi:uncharacterized protein